ncbi:unnamed protein product [Paramecium sonneborni]|uniref:Transmembrane protein n=1 Tax=Paramecium sonneborni TaxID=65129 RepID=A0A8S1QDH7_9CILI|nr:unnamed protein product [Paramecium sonneborni]
MIYQSQKNYTLKELEEKVNLEEKALSLTFQYKKISKFQVKLNNIIGQELKNFPQILQIIYEIIINSINIYLLYQLLLFIQLQQFIIFNSIKLIIFFIIQFFSIKQYIGQQFELPLKFYDQFIYNDYIQKFEIQQYINLKSQNTAIQSMERLLNDEHDQEKFNLFIMLIYHIKQIGGVAFIEASSFSCQNCTFQEILSLANSIFDIDKLNESNLKLFCKFNKIQF